MKKTGWWSLIVIFILLSGCHGCDGNKSREKPEVSDIKVNTNLLRFDKDLFDFAVEGFSQHRELMWSRYDSFYPFYLEHFVTGPLPAGDTAFNEEKVIKTFIADAYMHRIQDSINFYYNDAKDVEEELSQSFRYFKYYFPVFTPPKVLAINSGFSLSALTYDRHTLGIGLDLYLGGNNPDYDSAGIFRYTRHKLRREYITRNSMEVLYNLYFGEGEAERKSTLIEAIVDKGKKMYFLSLVLPDVPDSLILGFTQDQTTWCEKSEYEIWKFMNDKDLLYKSDFMEQKRYLDEGPGITGMPPEAPGSLGNWIGLQIVRKFMKETGNKIPLPALLLKYDGKTIFEKARYRPSKSIF